MTESDGIEEALSHNLREAMVRAEQVGRLLARRLDLITDTLARGAVAADRAFALHRLRRRVWKKAQEKLKQVEDPQWWERATPDQIAEVHEVAVTWRDQERIARKADDTIHQEVLDRYGLDLRTLTRQQVWEGLERSTNEIDGESKPTYDSPERRDREKQRMEREGLDPELIDTHMVVDTMNARPPHDAVQRWWARWRSRGPRGRELPGQQAEQDLGL
ncbi:hypothetical protein SAMN02745673_00934 [Marinactinospora thermotolerans DSM 45154]|uniref:Uncharacterized protein n=1 Tax=Marinactinospora thermotolerans DSM 45154 TaxID=1122192 RepID=A0A1T4M3Q5_9ACTN|nr:hypothetical protein [Marinactinospora thermotolerans]SJZ61620.1 hypothetical protein SAMN02745673_00934 [Marinactinospora thermotolerans DSM 45154]